MDYLQEYSSSDVDSQVDCQLAEKVTELNLSKFNLAKRHLIYSKVARNYEFEPLYSNESYTRVIISLTPDHSRLSKINGNIQYVKFDVSNLLICSSEKSVEYSIDPFKEVLFYEIILQDTWMRNVAQSIFPTKNINESHQYLHDIVLWENASSSIWKKVLDFIQEIEQSYYKKTIENEELCELLAQNIYRKIIHQIFPVFPGSEVHIEKLMKVKQVLLDHLNMPLPNLSQIAVQVTLSESTLKRHFKNVFGKSVYDYYLEKKMEYAKQILSDEPLTVNEIAERLGYEKVSNFIGIFKKRYGVSPGNIKKKTLMKKLEN